MARSQGQVNGLQKDLKEKMINVNAQKAQTDELIEKVSKEGAIAEEELMIANEEEEKTNKASSSA